MPDNKPKFNPNQPYTEIGVETQTAKPKFNPNESFTTSVDSVIGANPNEATPSDNTPDKILEGVKTNNDNEKELLKNLAIEVNKGRATHEDLRDAILTIQGQHPKQQGQGSYFVEDKDGVYIPKPLQKYEKPKSDNVVSVFSDKNQLETHLDSWERGKAMLGASLARTPEFLYDIAVNENFNKTANIYKPLIAEYNKHAKENGLKLISEIPSIGGTELHLPTSTELGDITGVHNKVAQQAEQYQENLGKDYQQKYDKGITEYWDKGEYGKAIGVLSNSIVESAPTTIALAMGGAAGLSTVGGTLLGGAVFGAQKKQEIDKEAPDMDETTKLGIAAASGLAEGFFEQSFGITKLGKMVGDVFRKEGKDAAKLFAEKAFKTAYAPAVGKYAGAVGGEGLGEAATQFAQNAIDKYSGYKPDLDLSQGVKDAFIIGIGAAGPVAALTAKVETASEKYNARRMEQSAYLFDVAKKGSDAEVAFKTDMDNAVKDGRISPERAAEVASQFGAYKAYHAQVGNTDLTDDQKKEVFALSFQKEQLEASLGDDVVEKDLSPPLLAIRNAKQKQAKDLQKQIDEIVLREDVQKQPVTADKTKGDIVKGDEKKIAIRDIQKRYGAMAQKAQTKEEVDNGTPTENKGETVVEGGKIQWNVFGNEEMGEWKVGEKTKTRGGQDAVTLSKQYIVSSVDGKTYTREYADANGIKYDNEHTVEHVVPINELTASGKTEAKPIKEYKDVPNNEWNDPKFDTREKQLILANELDKTEHKSAEGTIQQDQSYTDKKGHVVDTFNVTTPDGKTIRFASSMKRRPTTEEKGGYRGNTYEENFDDRDNPIGAKVGMKVVTLKDSGRKVIFVYNNEQGKKRGKHLGMVKESLRGNSNYSDADIAEIQELQATNMAPPLQGETVTEVKPKPTPKGPADVKLIAPKVVLGQPTRENFRTKYIQDKIQEVKDTGEYDEDLDRVYEKRFGEMYDQLNPESKEESKDVRVAKVRNKIKAYNQLGKREKKKEIGVNLLRQIQDETKSLDYTLGALKKGKITLINDKGTKVVNVGKKRDKSEIDKEKAQKAHEKRALNSDPSSVEHMVAMDIANGVRFNKGEFLQYMGEGYKGELPLGLFVDDGGVGFEEYKQRMAEHLGQDADSLPGDPIEIAQKAVTEVEAYTGSSSFRADAKKAALEIYERIENNGMTNAEIDAMAEHFGVSEENNDAIVETVGDNTEEEDIENKNQIDDAKTDEEKSDIVAGIIGEAKKEEGINPFDDETRDEDEEGKDIITGDPDAPDVFQKSSELQHAETEFKKAETELKASKKAFDSKRKELGKEINDDQEDLFGERKSVDENALFDERVDMGAYEDIITPIKQRYDKAVENYNKAKAKLEEVQSKPDSQQSLFQRKSAEKGAIEKIVNHLKKLMPNVKVEFDENLVDNEGKPAAGKWNPKTKTITINPYYAGTDTAIHEYGHILIDAIGYNNSIVQLAIKQLKGTPLWNKIAEAYPITNTYTEEMLGKEVLAEAIGREGAGIFDKVSEQSKFKQYLSYIFDWFKSKLGINKNIAKSLAKQIIGGIGTQNLATEGEVAFAKKKPKTLEEKTDKELDREATGNFNLYREKVLGINIKQLKKDLELITSSLTDPNIDDDTKEILTNIQANLKKEEKQHLKKYYDYLEDMKVINAINDEKSLNDRTEDELIQIYNDIINYQEFANKALLNSVKLKIAMSLNDRRINAIKSDTKISDKFDELKTITGDLSYLDTKLKVLSHMTESFPELQELSKMYDSAMFAKEKEAKAKKNTLEKLAIPVINEINKSLGISGRLKAIKSAGVTGTIASLMSSDSAKYFNYLEKDGQFLTIDEAKKQGLSDAKIELLKYMREMVAEREGILSDPDVYNGEMEVIKTDKGFGEAYKSEGAMRSFSNYLGNTHNIQNIRIKFTNPNTGKEEIKSFADVEKEILKYGDNGPIKMVKALGLLAKYNSKARKQVKLDRHVDQKLSDEKGDPNFFEKIVGGDFTLDSKGNLIGKFDRKRDKDRGYSKDFYKAAMEYIDDTAHVKHISPLMPYIDSIEYLNKNGIMERGADKAIRVRPNVVKWMEDWRDLHILKKEKEGDARIDAVLKGLRFLVSASTMWFNIPAGVMNLSIGIYNNWRAENWKTVKDGHKRLFFTGNRKINKDYAYGAINPYAVDILRKYHVVSTDIDSNPKLFAGKIFDAIMHGATRYGEFQVQGSQFLGLMSKEDYDSFEYKKNKHGIDELVIKEGVDEKALEERLLGYKNRVSDIQGKYSDKDRRNIQNTELGKSVFQFKVWMPDWAKERFGKEYITANGEVHKGSMSSAWNNLLKDGFKELRTDIKAKGVKAIWNNKAAMSNLKGLATISLLMAIQAQGDDDDDKRKAGLSVDKALADLLFIFDPNQLKFTATRPIASMGIVEKFLNAVEHLVTLEEYKTDSKYGDKGELKIRGDVMQALPGRKIIEAVAIDDDEDK